MDRSAKRNTDQDKTSHPTSAVRTVISWIVETDRQYRAAQSFIDETHKKY